MSDYLSQGNRKSLLKTLTGRADGGKVTPAGAVHKHERIMHPGKKPTAFASGGGVMDDDIDGSAPLERLDKKKRGKKSGKPDITIVIETGVKPAPNMPFPPNPPAPPMPAPMAPPMSGAPGGMPGGMPPAPKPPMPAPMGGPPPLLARRDGGRVARAAGGKADKTSRSEGDLTRGLIEEREPNPAPKGQSNPMGGDQTKGLKCGGRAKRASGGTVDQRTPDDRASDDFVKQIEAMSPEERSSYWKAFKEESATPSLNLRKDGGRAKRAWGGASNYPQGHPNGTPVGKAVPKRLDPAELSTEELGQRVKGGSKGTWDSRLGEVRKSGGKVSDKARDEKKGVEKKREGKKFGGDANGILKAIPLGIRGLELLGGKATGGGVAPNGKAGVDSGVGRLNQAKYYARKG